MRQADVHDSAAKNFDQFFDLGTVVVAGVDLHQHQVAFDVFLIGEIDHADDVDDLFELLADLVQHPLVSFDDERDAGVFRVLGLADGEAFDVERARRQHPGDVRQHSGLVHDQRRENMLHGINHFREQPTPLRQQDKSPSVWRKGAAV